MASSPSDRNSFNRHVISPISISASPQANSALLNNEQEGIAPSGFRRKPVASKITAVEEARSGEQVNLAEEAKSAKEGKSPPSRVERYGKHTIHPSLQRRSSYTWISKWMAVGTYRPVLEHSIGHWYSHCSQSLRWSPIAQTALWN